MFLFMYQISVLGNVFVIDVGQVIEWCDGGVLYYVMLMSSNFGIYFYVFDFRNNENLLC